jgi:hypothetical protein
MAGYNLLLIDPQKYIIDVGLGEVRSARGGPSVQAEFVPLPEFDSCWAQEEG